MGKSNCYILLRDNRSTYSHPLHRWEAHVYIQHHAMMDSLHTSTRQDLYSTCAHCNSSTSPTTKKPYAWSKYVETIQHTVEGSAPGMLLFNHLQTPSQSGRPLTSMFMMYECPNYWVWTYNQPVHFGRPMLFSSVSSAFASSAFPRMALLVH